MTYHIKDSELSEKEFFELKQCVGEFRRTCRDQAYGGNEESVERFKIAENLISFLNEIEWKNKNIK